MMVILRYYFFRGSFGFTDVKLIGSDKVIKLLLPDGKIFGTKLGHVHVITLGIDVGTEQGSLGGSLMNLVMASLRSYFLNTHWDLLLVTILDLRKASKWGI